MSERGRDSWRRRGEHYDAFIYVVTTKWGWGVRREGRVELKG